MVYHYIPSILYRSLVAFFALVSYPISIGYNVAEQLAIKGAKVYIGARSLEKAQSAVSTLKSKYPTAELKPLVMDLSDLRQVQDVAQSFVKKESRLDILVNNASLYAFFS